MEVGYPEVAPVTSISPLPRPASDITLCRQMHELNDIKVGDCLAIVSSMKGSSEPVLQQVTAVTSGLVRTRNYTFRKDGRSFSVKQKSLTARPATATEIEQWESRQKHETKPQQTEEQALASHLKSVEEQDWLRLGLPKLKSIASALRKSQRSEF